MRIGMLTLSPYERRNTNNNVRFAGKKLKPLTPKQQKLVEENMGLVQFVMSPKYYRRMTGAPRIRKLKAAMAAMMMNVFNLGNYSQDEYDRYVSAGHEGLIMAAGKYDPKGLITEDDKDNPESLTTEDGEYDRESLITEDDKDDKKSKKRKKFTTLACYWIASRILYEYKKQIPGPKISLNDPTEKGGDGEPEGDGVLYSIIPDKRFPSPVAEAISNEERAQVQYIFSLVDKINTPARNRKIFETYHRQGLSALETSRLYRITRQRVQHILEDMTRKIRALFEIEKDKEKKAERNTRILCQHQMGVATEKIAEQEDLSPEYINQIIENSTPAEREAAAAKIEQSVLSLAQKVNAIERQLEIFRTFHMNVMSYKEIADRFGGTPKGVEKAIFVMNRKIKKLLETENDEDKKQKRNARILMKHMEKVPIETIAQEEKLSAEYILQILRNCQEQTADNDEQAQGQKLLEFVDKISVSKKHLDVFLSYYRDRKTIPEINTEFGFKKSGTAMRIIEKVRQQILEAQKATQLRAEEASTQEITEETGVKFSKVNAISTAKVTVKKAEREKRNRKILELSAKGLTQREIAAELGCSIPTVCKVLSNVKQKDSEQR